MDEADDHESRAVEGETYLEGKLRAVRVIGEGGMGRVVEVVHTLTEHHRALKTLRGPLAHDPRAVKRFLREASAAGRIGNPHIVEIFDAGYLASGEPYLLMELLDGATLLDWIDASAPSWVALLDVFVQACDALEAAHAAGVVHRDLKPENMFVVEGEARPFLKLLDFGVSRFASTTSHGLTDTGTLIGTPQYMAPEQFDDDAIDGRADLFALGVILYECATGVHPFPGETLAQLTRQILLDRPPPPSQVSDGVPPLVDAVVERAMAKDRERRYATASDMGAALRDLRDHVAASLAPPPRGARVHEGGGHDSDEARAATEASLPPPAGLGRRGSTTDAPSGRREATGPLTVPTTKGDGPPPPSHGPPAGTLDRGTLALTPPPSGIPRPRPPLSWLWLAATTLVIVAVAFAVDRALDEDPSAGSSTQRLGEGAPSATAERAPSSTSPSAPEAVPTGSASSRASASAPPPPVPRRPPPAVASSIPLPQPPPIDIATTLPEEPPP